MRIFVPRETHPGETRAAVTPETAARFVQLGAEVAVESGLGAGIGVADEAYTESGASVSANRGASLGEADLVLRVRKPPAEEVELLKSGSTHVSLLEPFNEQGLVESLAARGVSALSLELIPRITRAQKMDVLSSQANLAGYVAVILAAERLPRILPMMMTPAGTIAPARVFVIGAGVAGLQAIATAKRLGARVDAFDTRPAVEEQVLSLAARFVKVDLGETGQTEQGYARKLTEEQRGMQTEAMARVCVQSDAVITTAQVFGRRAPVLITKETIARMRPGSVIVDLAVESGGNVEGVEADREVEMNGVRVVGLANLPGRVAVNASQMFASNVYSLIEDGWDAETKAFRVDPEDEIVKGCLVTHAGEVVNEQLRKAQRV
ncbi:MAG: Re/Si-specific NAD(P)(+) transhydrogenase subunit alpha [FCB group bacterium]|jgi:NAD(P) transhydrogenase subunit alpha|nr:Re/Si-specific NAD(P)(+) transhydrogenase subunit alpha [FCB group bacterium]